MPAERIDDMEKLKRTVEEKGSVLSGEVLKTDRFLNHAIDPELMDEIGAEFAKGFQDYGITRVLTIESGGIAPALMTALHLNVPMVFCKKTRPVTMCSPLSACVHSFTKNTDYDLCMESGLIEPGDRVLFIDDFLANGDAFAGLRSLTEQAGAELAGAGFCIEKSWQRGKKNVESTGVPCLVLASIQSMSEKGILWNPDESVRTFTEKEN